ncbi:MAG: acetyl-CoA carboxylase biotin carboxylase subunit [Calditrichaeota bacterium]|nr:acetyl-CoA carboxylase biotin carboxylase subunit [Calditrichota bacterium]
MFKKILIANRGEIALRIIRSCKDLGIKTIAVYSDIDRSSPHVQFADEAYPLGGTTSAETYLDGNKIIRIAKDHGAEAVHPGYGFLAENAAFARDAQNAGLVFIGPSPESIELMGSKTAARSLMEKHGVPTIPGSKKALQSEEEALAEAQRIGYPVLLKASAGGGGKGMRLVENPGELPSALQSASREAQSAFGDSSIYIEKYLEQPRHIEFQILADSHGNVVYLGERECSIQRRHQKIIEEAPSVVLDSELRKKMGRAAIQAAKACNYLNAGTIEFMLDKHRNFYFLEMNTRLQVEHPVTELVTGLDLVQEQIRIACGEAISLSSVGERFWGHAVECRIYAEDVENNFTPSPGKITYLKPADGPGIREDSGVMQGNEISLYYDPMISKLIAWGKDREQAVRRMIRALKEYQLSGIKTNIPFLIRILQHPAFISGELSTTFIDEHRSELFKQPVTSPEAIGLMALLKHINRQRRISYRSDKNHKTPTSQWKMLGRMKHSR